MDEQGRETRRSAAAGASLPRSLSDSPSSLQVVNAAIRRRLLRKPIRGRVVRPINLEKLSPRVRSMIQKAGVPWLTRNSRCPCGSGRRFKRCCMEKD